MEPLTAVEHCITIGRNSQQAYIAVMVTNDDSSTRANCKHSFKGLAERDFPGQPKRLTEWPFHLNKDGKKVYLEDYGHIPLDVPEVKECLSDVGHRVKVIGSACYNLKYSNEKIKKKQKKFEMSKADCEHIKKLAGYYFKEKDNRELPFESFCQRAHCLYQHHFNVHTNCNIRWCKYLKKQDSKRRQEDGEAIDYQFELSDDEDLEEDEFTGEKKWKYRNAKVDSAMYEAVKSALQPYLVEEELEKVYHAFDTQKNESNNRKMTAIAPKD